MYEIMESQVVPKIAAKIMINEHVQLMTQTQLELSLTIRKHFSYTTDFCLTIYHVCHNMVHIIS